MMSSPARSLVRRGFTPYHFSFKSGKGFTLIEVMIVIAIIGLLSSVILTSLTVTKDKANTAKRIANAKELEQALEVYYINNGAYPTTSGSLSSDCSTWGGPNADWIPGLRPTYIAALPSDPDTDGINKCCYLYRSNGTNFKLTFAYQCTTKMTQGTYASYPRFIDPSHDSGPSSSLQDWNGATSLTDWAIYTPGYASQL